VELAQQQVLGDVDDRGALALSTGASRGVPGDVTASEGDAVHAAAGRVRGSKGKIVSAMSQ
jgi:hypothetical protein